MKFDINDINTYKYYELTDEDKKGIDKVVEIVVKSINEGEPYSEHGYDDLVSKVGILEELHDNDNIDPDLYQYNIELKIRNEIENKLAKEGIVFERNNKIEQTFLVRKEKNYE